MSSQGIHRSFQHLAKFFKVTTIVQFIVTAGVHQGLGSGLINLAEESPILLTF